MQLQLDSQDIHLLRELAGLGAVSSRVLDQDHRLERLELAFPPCPPPAVAHRCSGTSTVVRNRPTPHRRACWNPGS
jgi:hypothetical protein